MQGLAGRRTAEREKCDGDQLQKSELPDGRFGGGSQFNKRKRWMVRRKAARDGGRNQGFGAGWQGGRREKDGGTFRVLDSAFPMQDALRKVVVDVQTLDGRIALLESEVAALPRRLTMLETRLKSTQARVETAKVALQKEEARRRRMEGDIGDLKLKADKFQFANQQREDERAAARACSTRLDLRRRKSGGSRMKRLRAWRRPSGCRGI